MIAISGPRGPLFAARDLGTCMHSPDHCWGALAGATDARPTATDTADVAAKLGLADEHRYAGNGGRG